MITPAFSLTATERVLPKLALDFTTASLDSRVTFTRTTGASNPATYVNSSGVVTAATNNQPRFDYDPAALTCKGLLIEESRANLVTYSQDFTNAAWTGGTLTNMTLGAASGNSPDGTADAGVLTATDPACSYQSANSIATTIVGTQTMSIYVKSTNRQWWRIRVYRTSANAATCWFDLQNGVVGSNASVGSLTFSSATISNAGNGWWRISMVVSSSAAGTNANFWAAPATSNGGTSGGAIGDALNIWGHQYETGAFATSYIPTTSAALTRNADVATMTGTNFSDWYNQSEGALSCEFAFIGYQLTNRDRIVSISDSTGNEEIGIIQNTTNGYGRFEVVDGGVNQALLDCINTTMVAGTTYQICGTYKVNSFCGSGSLGSQATDSSGSIPTPDRMCIGGYAPGTATAIFNGHLKSINYWPQRITNNETLAFAKI